MGTGVDVGGRGATELVVVITPEAVGIGASAGDVVEGAWLGDVAVDTEVVAA